MIFTINQTHTRKQLINFEISSAIKKWDDLESFELILKYNNITHNLSSTNFSDFLSLRKALEVKKIEYFKLNLMYFLYWFNIFIEEQMSQTI